ncbi:MAG: putative pirin-like protein [Acidobacteria bacterium]|nr:putative pirin-like protein [Acidobacteriota bacterium]
MNGPRVAAEACVALGAGGRQFDEYPARTVRLGDLPVLRALPVRDRRLIGPWCFLDRFGPLAFSAGTPMDVAPHPHIGLQTVTWLLEGEVVHDDSLLQEAVLRPGGVNVMTSGRAIAHSERTPHDNTGRLDGVQLWAALPEADRHGPPSFQHVGEVPSFEAPGGLARVFSGTIGPVASPARHYSELVGADLRVHAGRSFTVPLQPGHEHGVLLLGGDGALEGQSLEPGTLYYLGTQRPDVTVESRHGARILLVGGRPFGEAILMWWNFVARTPEEIREARDDWEARRRFGDVPGYPGARIPAPELARLARPNPVS